MANNITDAYAGTRLPDYYTSSRSDVLAYIPRGIDKVLEIGCGDANFANLLPHCEYWGVEPNEQVSPVHSPNIVRILRGPYDEVYRDMPDDYFDLVVANDVIEHMLDHDRFFETIKKKMVVGGRIVGTVPNVRHISNLINLLFHKDWHYQQSGILDITHYRFFTENSLMRTLLAHDYLIERVSPVNRVLCRRKGFKCLMERLLCLLVGKDSEFNQLLFVVRKT